MAPTTTRQWILANKPQQMPELEGPDATFALKNVDLPELKEDEVLVKTYALSNDPAQRGWIDPNIPADRLYVPPVDQGAPMRARGMAEVIASRSEKFKEGTYVQGTIDWTEHSIHHASTLTPCPDLPNGLSRTHYLGAFGSTGLTAYFGITAVGQARLEHTVVVSGAAGGTGSVVVQWAKNVIGCKRVIGIAGTKAKCEHVKSLGADECVDYKSPTFENDLINATDGCVDVYYDNVGGGILDAMLARMKKGGTVVACGAISSYNDRAGGVSLSNWFQIISQRLKVQGFIILDFLERFGEARDALTTAVKEGKLHVGEGSETVVKTAFEDVPKTWIRLFESGNDIRGKLVTLLA